MRLALLTLPLALACTSGKVSETPLDSGGDADETDQAYDLDHMLEVALELPEDDWDALRTQTRTLQDTLLSDTCQEEPFESPFTWFEASATLDGQTFDRVDVRKKGFLGSMSEDKPALKLDLGEYDKDATLHGVRRLTLNNAVSDRAIVRQCVAYGFFGDVGIPASRCSLAHVTVNGEDLGVYVNVEPIKDPMLERHFESAEGNLYEGTLSDFREGWTGSLEKKNNEDEDDWSDIQALVDAAAADDEDLLDALDAVIDLDAFFTFWAAEVLIQHADGYAGNTNNFYMYNDPGDGRFRFLPWGVDAVLYDSDWEAEDGDEGITSVYASGVLANRLYAHDEGRERYLDRVDTLLDSGWDPDVFQDRVDRMLALIEDVQSSGLYEDTEAAADAVIGVVNGRAADVRAEIGDGGIEWPYGMRDSYCFEPWGQADLEFETTWGSLYTDDVWGTGESSMTLDFGEGAWSVGGSALIGTAEGETYMYAPAFVSDTEAVMMYFALPEDQVAPGLVDLDFDASIGALFYADFATMDDFEFVSYVAGTLTFDQAGTDEGAAVVGRFDGAFLSL